MYFVGASTHPGTGVPIVLAGARITTEQILRDRGMRMEWEEKEMLVRDEGVRQGKGIRDIDRVRKGGGGAILSNFEIWILAFVVLVGTLAYINSGLVILWDPELKRGWGSGNVKGLGH